VSVGTATARAVLHDVDAAREQGLKGRVIAIGPSDGSVAWETANCDGSTHLAAWMVELTGAKGPLIVTIRHGSSPAKLVSLGSAKVGTDGGFTKFATITGSREYFQVSAHLPPKDLGASGCQASFAGVPCVGATMGAGRTISGTMRVRR
jgi:hypothetical protein